jgi:hypothetical protein
MSTSYSDTEDAAMFRWLISGERDTWAGEFLEIVGRVEGIFVVTSPGVSEIICDDDAREFIRKAMAQEAK